MFGYIHGIVQDIWEAAGRPAIGYHVGSLGKLSSHMPYIVILFA